MSEKFNAHVLIMQYNQLPKLHFRFKKIYALNLLNENQSIINEKLINFNAIIPEKISKQVLRMQRSQNLRKRRIESNIHSELINFFASGLVPTLLRSDYALWSIVRVKTF